MSSIKRSNAVTLYPSSLYDDDIEAALKTNLLTENEKETAYADAGAEYDSDDDEEDVKQAYVTRNEDQQLLLLCYPTTVGSPYVGFAHSEYVGESDVLDSTKLYLYLPVRLRSSQFA
eukprot:scaffold8191_cov297-Alexandrium_tamarense.AAC.1